VHHNTDVLDMLASATSGCHNGHDNICQLVLNSGHVSDDDIATALSQHVSNQLSTAQLLVRHGHLNTQHLTKALSDACRMVTCVLLSG
jgi:hypothetical protein